MAATEPSSGAQGTPSPPGDPRLGPGADFGEYQIEVELGRGGMGVVYRARHRTLNRLCALKILNVSATTGPRGIDDPRFLREARNNARLEHHNIVSVHTAGVIDGLLFIEMQLVDGQALGRLKRPLTVEQATRYVEQVAHALQHAHRRGIIHRDIKPDNLLLTPDGVVKVSDFGLAKQPTEDTALTAPGSLLGTPSFMAPEQWRGEPTDARTDLYALGGTYFHLITGQPPYRGKLPDLMHQHVEAPVPLAHELNPEVPQAVSQLIVRLMAKRPFDRPQSAAELIGELRRLQLQWEQPATTTAAAPGAVGGPLPDTQPPPARPAPEAPLPSTATVRRLPRWPVLGLLWVAISALVLLLDTGQVWNGLEQRSVDRRMVARDPTPRSDRVLLVLIDNRTAARLKMPLRRHLLATVLEGLFAAGARTVALDLLITDPLGDTDDLVLAGLSAEHPGLVHAMDLIQGRPGAADPALARFAVPVATDGLPATQQATLPIPALLARAPHLGNVELVVDEDGLIRRVPLLVRHDNRAYPALALTTAALALGTTVDRVRWSPGRPLTIPAQPELDVPVDRHGCMTISVRGSLQTRRPLSFLDVLHQVQAGPAAATRLARRLRGRVVVIGTSVSGQHDVQPLPGLRAPPLVLAHAMAVETLLGRDFIRPAGLPLSLLCVALAALLALLAGARLRWYVALLLLPLLALAHWLLASSMLAHQGLVLPVVAPVVALALAGATGGGLRFRLAQQQRRLLADALGRYVPRKVSARILADPAALRLGGHRKELSLVVVRLQGFGALSEKLEPEEVGDLLARFFAVVSDVVTRHDGTLDRFDGDGVRAFFGDPVACSDHAARALSCALQIRGEALATVARWAGGGRSRPPLGIGVHTGYVTVGNIGAVQRMEYTVVGRNVEIAEQLALAAPPGTILTSARTRGITADQFVFEPREMAGQPLDTFEACARR